MRTTVTGMSRAASGCQKATPRRKETTREPEGGRREGPRGNVKRGSSVRPMEEKGSRVAGSRCTKSKMPCWSGSRPVMKVDQATGLCGGMVVPSRLKLPCCRSRARFGSVSQWRSTKFGSMPSMPSTITWGTLAGGRASRHATAARASRLAKTSAARLSRTLSLSVLSQFGQDHRASARGQRHDHMARSVHQTYFQCYARDDLQCRSSRREPHRGRAGITPVAQDRPRAARSGQCPEAHSLRTLQNRHRKIAGSFLRGPGNPLPHHCTVAPQISQCECRAEVNRPARSEVILDGCGAPVRACDQNLPAPFGNHAAPQLPIFTRSALCQCERLPCRVDILQGETGSRTDAD